VFWLATEATLAGRKTRGSESVLLHNSILGTDCEEAETRPSTMTATALCLAGVMLEAGVDPTNAAFPLFFLKKFNFPHKLRLINWK